MALSKKSTPSKKGIKVTKVGGRATTTIDRKNYSTPMDAASYSTLKAKVDAYNTKPSDASKKAIIKLLTPKKEAKKAEIRTKTAPKKAKLDLVKAVRQSVEDKTLTEGERTELQSLLRKAGVAETAVEAPKVAAPTRQSRGEH